MKELATNILRYRWVIIIVVALITAFLGFQIKNMQINSDVISSLPDDDPDAALFKKIGKEFGGNKVGMIILEAETIFDNEVLGHVQQLTDSLSLMEGISTVTSITNIIDIRGGEYGFEVGQLIDEYALPFSPEELDGLKTRVLQKDMYRGVIVSEDATATVILFTLLDDADLQKMSGRVKAMTQYLNLSENIYYAGLPMMVGEISDLIARDLLLLLPIAFLIIALVLAINFKSAKGVILPLLSATIAIVWTLGLMVLGGFEMSMVTNNIPLLLLAVGSAYTIHVINKINQVKEKDYRVAIVTAMTYIFVPVALTALTTVVGFISFVFEVYLTMIRDFGIFTALGTFFSAVLALFFTPAIMYAFSSKKKKETDHKEAYKKSILATYFLGPLTKLLFKHPKYTLTVWGVLMLLSIAAIFLIERNVDVKDYFKEGNPAREAEDIMIEKFGGSKPIFVLFKGDLQDPEVLNTMLETEAHIKNNSHVTSTQSIANLIVEMNDALGEGRKIPDSKEKIEQLWFLIDGNPILRQMVNDDLSEGLIISKFSSADNDEKENFAKYMDDFVVETSTENCEIILTGMPFIDMKMNRSLLRSQLRSLGIAIIALIILVGIIMRSFAKGLYATAPIIATIIILFGVMGATGIPLNIVTVLVASIALGIGIDYSIHVITYFNHSYKNNGDLRDALEETILISGKAIFINVVSVSAGFLVLLFSQMLPLQYFGTLMALSMVGSGLAALTLLPVILVLVNRKHLTLNDV